ncbi:Ubiquinone/menaquinone biosynthesis C-methyltransferase UbiE [Candidatus Gugararchaeum adminiculabundum]|nr:Ubiquinone/menaquinone biosynthesis C-methyltransferase UbiE [Candidatus Gugararchaeum adminiculabundum]
MTHSSKKKKPASLEQAWNREYSRKNVLWNSLSNEAEVKLTKGEKVLELGCGNGQTLKMIAPGGAKIWAVDFSRKAGEICYELKKKYGWKNVEIERMDASELRFEDGTFDSVIAFHIIGNIEKEKREIAIAEIARVLKKGGRVFAKVFSVNDFRCPEGKDKTKVKSNGIREHYFMQEELDWLFEEAGMKKIEGKRISWKVKYEGKQRNREKLFAVYLKPD